MRLFFSVFLEGNVNKKYDTGNQPESSLQGLCRAVDVSARPGRRRGCDWRRGARGERGVRPGGGGPVGFVGRLEFQERYLSCTPTGGAAAGVGPSGETRQTPVSGMC